MKTYTTRFLSVILCIATIALQALADDPTRTDRNFSTSKNSGARGIGQQGGFGGGFNGGGFGGGFGGGGFGQGGFGGGFGGGGFGGGGFGGGGFGGGGFGGGGGGMGGGSGKEAAKNIETFGTKTTENITKAQENFTKSIQEGAKNNLDFNKLTPDLNNQVSDGLKSVNEGIAKINEQFKSEGERKSIGEATLDQNIEAITKTLPKAQMDIDAAIASRYTENNGVTPQASGVNNISKISGAGGSSRNSDPIAQAMGAEPQTSSDPNHSESRGFTRGVAYKSPFGGTHGSNE